jgi:hypothetical protein
MANKRQLKKHVRYTCGDLAAEILIASHSIEEMDQEKAKEIVINIAALQVKSIKHVSFDFDKSFRDFDNKAAYKKARHAYFKKAYTKLINEFNDGVKQIVKDMNAALPQAVKDANVSAMKE